MACNWLMVTSSGDNNWPSGSGVWVCSPTKLNKKNINKPKAEQETAQPFNKSKNSALLTLRRSQKYYEIFSNNVLRKNITRRQLRLETIEIALFKVGSVPGL